MRLAGYDYSYAAENLAVKFLKSSSVVKAWMNSPSHRATILSDKYSEVGIGISFGKYKGEPAFFVALVLAEPSIPLEIQEMLKQRHPTF